LNEVSAVEGDSPPCSDLGKSSLETAIVGFVQQIQPAMGTQADGQLLMQFSCSFTALKNDNNKEELWHMATVVFSREGSPPKSQHVPENGNQVPLQGQKCMWSFIPIWLKATTKLLRLPQYMVTAGEPQPLWAVGSELLDINTPVL